jgi:hypothetical protein
MSGKATTSTMTQAVPLVRFETLTLVRVGDLRAALMSCEHLAWVNPYHEG